ncbi:AEC family transporter [Elizabethkingia meningoseptica]|uniref:AEC family transporter n=1 Tax=Elizabethkingia meningoseptica TaxID=238 RepID=UPI000332C19C|nr:AEC family transporter [Elizabethkingia meningoseptica]AQX06480.1 transporter [Elizabethkingia meningoseptica]AQX48527.1 transporter [Elizabethkingia meningoseptica]EOR29283.1 auxin efflux carrier [Elizabethkingia meningoseptica ATCC 13253 = NBRC 12535]KUY16614.1 transporter [Elizabethkingia meningoseptica]MDE5437076.1 AEC family transporter [Elizabethkingia meningoseptica]
MINFVLIVVCIVAGMIFKATKSIHPDAHKGINTWILYIALPAVSFKYLPKVQWSQEMLFPIVSTFFIAIGSWFFMMLYSRKKGYSARSRSTLELASGYSNTSFIGFPLISALYGEGLLSIAIICDQTMFLSLSTLGIVAALRGGSQSGSISAKFILKRLFTFPPFLGCVGALLLSQVVDLEPVEPFFDKLAATVGPLALFSVGLQLKFNGWKKLIPQISTSMLYKLLLAPAAVLGMALLFGIKGNVAKVSILESAMPTLISSSIIAEQFKLNTKLTNLIIGISIVVGFFSILAWFGVVEYLF